MTQFRHRFPYPLAEYVVRFGLCQTLPSHQTGGKDRNQRTRCP